MGTHRIKAHDVTPDAADAATPFSISEASGRIQGGTFAIDTTHARIAAVCSGVDALPFLFLHGNSACKEVFGRQLLGPFGDQHCALAIDLPGHGDSGNAHDPASTYSITGYADAAVEVLEALDMDQVAIIGWSLGGHVALEMMARFPGVVGVMLVGTPPLGHGVEALMQAYRPHELTNLLAQPQLSDEEAARLAQAVVGSENATLAEAAIKRTDAQARPLMFGSLMSGAFEDERALVASSDMPVAVVAGAEDPFVSTDYLAAIPYANLWAGVCHLLPEAHHAPFLAQPHLFDQLLTKFAGDMQTRACALRNTPPLSYSG